VSCRAGAKCSCRCARPWRCSSICPSSRVHARRLADLFWSGLDEATARRNLRRALHRLRAAGLGDVLAADDDSIGLIGVDTDLHAFERAVGAGRLAEALALRAGAFCDGLGLEDAEGFEQWLRQRRERFQREWRAVAATRARELEAAGDVRAALAVQQQLLDDDPLQEATYRELMRLHDALGERVAALALYARCETTLRDELRLEPLPATRLLAERIHANRSPPAVAAEAADGEGRPRRAPRARRPRRGAARGPRSRAGADRGAAAGRRPDRRRRRSRQVAPRLGSTPPRRRRARRRDGRRRAGALHRDVVVDPFSCGRGCAAGAGDRRPPRPLASPWRRDLARLLPELRPTRRARRPSRRRKRREPACSRRSRQALAVAAAKARIVLFDDLQWADASSLELLAHLARRHRQEPATMARVIATARADELAANRPATSVVQAIEKEGELSRVPLGAFDEWSMLQLVQRLSNSEGGVRFAARLGAATGGNVFFALETIRALFESGELRLEPGQGWSTPYDSSTVDYAELPLPASVVDAVRARVARLGPAAQRLLEAAALAEDGSSLAEIQGATALSDWEALDGVERATAAHVVDRAGEGYRFVHALVRVAIRSAMSPERQRVLHGRLAATLEPLQAAPARIAMHWQQAGQAEKAAQAWIRAAESAAAFHAHREAMEHFERAAALTARRGAGLRSARPRHRTRLPGRMRAEARELVRVLLEKVGPAGSSKACFQALTHAADQASLDHDFALSEQYALRALREFEPPDGRIHVQALAAAAFAALQLDRKADALDTYRSALEIAQRHGLDKAVALMAAAGSMTATELDRLDEAAALRDLASPRCTTTAARRSGRGRSGRARSSRVRSASVPGRSPIWKRRARSTGRAGSAIPCRSSWPTCARRSSTTASRRPRAPSSRSWPPRIRAPTPSCGT
jgi:DNA-binding SARP family transcriptional activator